MHRIFAFIFVTLANGAVTQDIKGTNRADGRRRSLAGIMWRKCHSRSFGEHKAIAILSSKIIEFPNHDE
jgi:hypothetical protein